MDNKLKNQILCGLYVFSLLAILLWFTSPFVVSILLAGSVALALYPIQEKLEARGMKTGRAAFLVTAAFAILVSVPFLVFTSKGIVIIVSQLQKVNQDGLLQFIERAKGSVFRYILQVLDGTPLETFLNTQKLNSYLKSFSKFGLEFFQNMLSGIPVITMFFIIMILCVFSFLYHSQPIKKFFQEMFGFNAKKMNLFTAILIRDSKQVYISNIVTGFIQAFIVSTGVYFIVDVDWFLVFFVTFVLSFIPVVGAAPTAFIFALVAFVQDHYAGAIILVVVGSLTGIVDNILRPYLSSLGETRAPQAVSFICILGGAMLLGVPGLFLGLLVAAICYDTLPLFWKEF